MEYNKIGDNAFYHCYQLAGEFTIPASIKYIGMQAFEKCNITKLTCTSELKEIGDRAFKQNYQLHTVDLSNINKIGVEAFDMKNDDNNKPVLSTVSLGGNDIRIYSKAFRKCCYMTDFKLKNGAQIKQLNDGVFLDCRLIKSLAVQTIINNYAANSDQKYNGMEFDIEGTELLAIALCHEIDHLSGILFTDKADELLTSEQLEERKK